METIARIALVCFFVGQLMFVPELFGMHSPKYDIVLEVKWGVLSLIAIVDGLIVAIEDGLKRRDQRSGSPSRSK
jgi:hypothetical protein